jgi:hypothetical protein
MNHRSIKVCLSAWVALATVLFLAACGNDGSSLTVVVATGLVPGPEFTFVEVSLVEGGDIYEGVNVQRMSEARAIFGTEFARGKRVATFEGIHPGTYVAIVSLLRTDGSTLIRRRVRVILASDFVLVVHLTRDCVGVTCPQAGGSAALTECLDGQCVDARCNPPDPTFCPDITFCLTDTECPATASCATGRCVGGVCEEEMNTDACTLNAYCDPDPVTGGCMPLAMTPDAGVLEDGSFSDMQIYDDASSDASLVPDAGLTVICGTVCTLTDVPCAVGYWLCAPGSAPVCTDLGADREDGALCGTDLICNRGRCIACEDGASCVAGCREGTLHCAVAPVCEASATFAVAGTPCVGTGASVCDAAGDCIACENGITACIAGCARGHLTSCESGGVCTPDASAFVPAGTSCGEDSVCETDGTCAHCLEGEDCSTADGCGIGRVSCSAGVVCSMTVDYEPESTTCPDGACNGEGTCCGPASVEQFDFYYGTGCGVMSDTSVQCWNRWAPAFVVHAPSISDFVQVSTGDSSGCGVRSDGSVYCFGLNYYGQLGDGTLSDNTDGVQTLLPGPAQLVAVSGISACAVLQSGAVYCWGYLYWKDEFGDGLTPTPIRLDGVIDAVEVDVSYQHACVRTALGDVYCVGANTWGEAGSDPSVDGDPLYDATQVLSVSHAVDLSITDGVSCAVLGDGSVSCWGYQVESGAGSYVAVPQSALGFTDAVQVATGSNAVCVRRALPGGELWCWGDSRMLGTGDASGTLLGPTRVPGLGPVASVGLGTSVYACATLAASKQLFCWGLNDDGQLGFGSGFSPHYSPVAVCGPL